MVRLSYYNPQKAISILNMQDRGTFTYDNGTVTPETPFGIVSPATSNTFLFPLPSAEVTANPKLSEPPVPYF